MAHAEKCPVCEGEGEVRAGPGPRAGAADIMMPCHGCGGKGWVEVSDVKAYIETRCPRCGEVLEPGTVLIARGDGSGTAVCSTCYALEPKFNYAT